MTTGTEQINLQGEKVETREWDDDPKEPPHYISTDKFKLRKNTPKLDKLLEKGDDRELAHYIRHNLRPMKNAEIEDADYDEAFHAIRNALGI